MRAELCVSFVHVISFMKLGDRWELSGKDSQEYTGIKHQWKKELEVKTHAKKNG